MHEQPTGMGKEVGNWMPPGPTSIVVSPEKAAIMKDLAVDYGLQVEVREENQETMAGPKREHQGRVTVLIEGGNDSLVDLFVSYILEKE